MTITRCLSLILLVSVLAAGGAAAGDPAGSRPAAGAPGKTGKSTEVQMTLKLTSPAFVHQGAIPAEYTCEGKDTSPELHWTGVPDKAKSLALIVDDPDAPDPAKPLRTWVHWVLYNIPVQADSLPKGVAAKDLPPGALPGLGDSKEAVYHGPCPPIGRHRYFHKLYALDVVLPDLKTPTKAQLLKAMEGHVLASTELVGTYRKAGK